MSILIKGMAMPKNCEECDFNYDLYRCMITSKSTLFVDSIKRQDNCPLIELPPHGDLIDRRKLPLAFIDITDLPVDRCLPVYLKDDVDSAPIVVESENRNGF